MTGYRLEELWQLAQKAERAQNRHLITINLTVDPCARARFHVERAVSGRVAGLRFKQVIVERARFQGYDVMVSKRGMLVAAGQRPDPGTIRFRGQTVEVDVLMREPYRWCAKAAAY